MADIENKIENQDLQGNGDTLSSVENENTKNVNESSDADNAKNDSQNIELLLAKIASLEATNKKQKNQIDKMTSAEAKRVREERAKMTIDEQQEIARFEAEEEHKRYVEDLEKFKKTTEAKNRYLMQEMPLDLAEKAAEAEISGDMDTLSVIQKQFSDGRLKKAREEWMRSRPEINAGTGETKLTKEQFDKMSMIEKSALKRTNPKEYERLRSL